MMVESEMGSLCVQYIQYCNVPGGSIGMGGVGPHAWKSPDIDRISDSISEPGHKIFTVTSAATPVTSSLSVYESRLVYYITLQRPFAAADGVIASAKPMRFSP